MMADASLVCPAREKPDNDVGVAQAWLKQNIETDTGRRRHLVSGAPLYRCNDPKLFIYRVLEGTLCVHHVETEYSEAVFRFKFPGDVLGLGFLSSHAESARAIANTIVECLPLDEQEMLVANDRWAKDELDAVTEWEFEYRRLSLATAAQNPLMRVASTLLVLSSANLREGRRPDLIDGQCFWTACGLGLAGDETRAALAELQHMNLVKMVGPDGMLAIDPGRLEQLADSPQALNGGYATGRSEASHAVHSDTVTSIPPVLDLTICSETDGAANHWAGA
jgi:CRP/FNR family transcriptional regulator